MEEQDVNAVYTGMADDELAGLVCSFNTVQTHPRVSIPTPLRGRPLR